MSESDDETHLETTVNKLVDEPNPEENVLEIQMGSTTVTVTRKAKQSMSSALSAMANQPTVFFRCMFAVTAVCEILDVDMLSYVMPQTIEELRAFDWDRVVPGVKETYPQGTQPSDLEFEKVRTVHQVVKAEKDAEARAVGLPKSGVQSYITYKQRWKQLRDIAAVYRHICPVYTLSTTMDQMKAELKLCTSMQAIEDVLKDTIKKHLAKRKREERKRQEQLRITHELAEIVKKQEETKQEVEQKQQELERVAEEKEQATEHLQGLRTRNQRKEATQTLLNGIVEREKEAAEVIQAAKEAEVQLRQKRKQAQDKLIAISQPEIQHQPKKKKTKRKEVSLLDDEPSPPQIVSIKGEAWKPPMRVGGGGPTRYETPGSRWEEANKTKVRLLNTLTTYLRNEGILDELISFRGVMEFIGADCRGEELDFNERVYIHLVALIIEQWL